MASISKRGIGAASIVKDQRGDTYRLVIGDYLMRVGHITRSQLEEATKWIRTNPNGFLTSFLLKKNYIEPNTVCTVLSRQYNIPTINLAEREIELELSKIVPYEVAKKFMCVPYNKKDNKLYLAMLEPTNSRAVTDITKAVRHQVMLGVAPLQSIVDTFRDLYKIDDAEYHSYFAPLNPKEEVEPDTKSLTVDNLGALISDALDDFSFGEATDEDTVNADMYSAENSTIINLANQVLIQAIQEGASDIHIEPFEKQFYVRYRIDGSLYKRTRLPLEIKNALIARLKIMSRLDITERRLPQDGRIKMRISKTREIDFRVSSLPTLFGESVVLRILDKSGLNVDLTKLGFSQRNYEQIQDAIYRPNGMFLVTGPTGSGKTVTLYSCLSLRNTDDVKILTAEDPVEFNFSGVNQVNVVREAGMTFAKALKAFLRQDPDICMIGEIRDLETGEIAVEAAMTGHLVLSTLHTNDAPSTVTRLMDMGVEPFNVAAALVLCTAQRLLRKICPKCKVLAPKLPVNKLIEAGFKRDEVANITLYQGEGCEACKGTGYKGRLGAFELMGMSDLLADAISSHVPEAQLRKIALKEGMTTLRQDGLLKVSQGLTTLEQVFEKTIMQKESMPHYLLNPDELIFENGDTIIREGNTDSNFYKLIQGTLGVYKGQSKIAEIFKVDSFFGEMSSMIGEPRSATVKSHGKSVVKVFPGDKLKEVMEGYPDISKTILNGLVDRLSTINVRLQTSLRDKSELERTYISQLTSTVGAASSSQTFHGEQAGDNSASDAPRSIAGSAPPAGDGLRSIAGSAPRSIAGSAPPAGDGLRSIAGSAPPAGDGLRSIAGSAPPAPQLPPIVAQIADPVQTDAPAQVVEPAPSYAPVMDLKLESSVVDEPEIVLELEGNIEVTPEVILELEGNDGVDSESHPADAPLAVDGVDSESHPGDAPLAVDDGVDSESQPGDAPLAVDGVDSESQPGDAPLAVDGVDSVSQPGDAPLAVDGVDSVSQPEDAPLAVDGVDSVSQPGDAPLAADGVDSVSQPGDAPLATDGVDSVSQPEDATLATDGVILDTELDMEDTLGVVADFLVSGDLLSEAEVLLDMEAADMEAADMEAADMEAADMEAADMEVADMEVADMEVADMEVVLDMESAATEAVPATEDEPETGLVLEDKRGVDLVLEETQVDLDLISGVEVQTEAVAEVADKPGIPVVVKLERVGSLDEEKLHKKSNSAGVASTAVTDANSTFLSGRSAHAPKAKVLKSA